MNKLRDRQKPTDHNNNNLSPPPSPSAVPPVPGPGPFQPSPPSPFIPPPPPSGGFFETFQPHPQRSDNSFGNFHIPSELSSFNNRNNQELSGNLFGSQTHALTRENEKVVQLKFQKELDDTIYQLLESAKPEVIVC